MKFDVFKIDPITKHRMTQGNLIMENKIKKTGQAPDVKMTIDCKCGAILIAYAQWVNFPKNFEITCDICSRKYSIHLTENRI